MEQLSSKIESFLRTGAGPFQELALDLFAYQFEKNRPYQAYVRSQDVAPSDIKRWQDIPAVPVQAFKSAELATFPVGRSAAIFESSGTTIKTPSRHFLKSLTCYETSLKASFEKWVLPSPISGEGRDSRDEGLLPHSNPLPRRERGRMPFFILTPPPNEAPRSSLTWMMDVVKRKWGAAGSQYVIRNGRLDELLLATLLKKSQTAEVPVVLLGTTLAYLAFFEFCLRTGNQFALAKGSRLMDTGGMKGMKREISRPDFVRQAGAILGIPEARCINEYGMCEMSSQFYGKGNSTVLHGPAWVRTLVVDPLTGVEVPAGETGLLRHFDLANVDSVMAIQTEDMGKVASPWADANPLPMGEGACGPGEAFILLGRAPTADLKGCSLAAETFLR